MAYIGKEPAVGNFVKLDAISTSSTNTYNLTLDSAAFVPESANHMLVSLNGVIQAPQTSFSVSGSTITFLPSSRTLSSSDSIDFIMVYGNVLDIGTPSDSTVTNAKTNFVSTSSAAGLQIKGDGTTDGYIQLNCSQNSHGVKLKSPAHSASQSYTLTLPATAPATDKIIQTDSSGNLSFIDTPSGAMTKIAEVSASGSSNEIAFQNCFSSTYRNYLIIGNSIHGTNSNEQELLFQYYSGTNTAINSGYYDRFNFVASTGSAHSASQSGYGNNSALSAVSPTAVGDALVEASNFMAYFFAPYENTSYRMFTSQTIGRHATNSYYYAMSGGGVNTNTGTAYTGIRFTFSQSGNFKSGSKIVVYGLS